MDDSGFPRTPDRPVKLLGTCVRYLRSVVTSIGARGPDFLGGCAIADSYCLVESSVVHLPFVGLAVFSYYRKHTLLVQLGCHPSVAEPPKKSGPRAPIDVSTDLR